MKNRKIVMSEDLIWSHCIAFALDTNNAGTMLS